WCVGTDASDPSAPGCPGRGQGVRTLGDFRLAGGPALAAARLAIRLEWGVAVGTDAIALAWYADVEYDWGHRCCADPWVAWERLAGCSPSASAFYSGADLWGRRRHE